MSVNTKYAEFSSQLRNIIQNSGLEVGAAYFILKDVVKEVEALYYAAVNRELQDQEQEQKDEGGSNDE